MRLDRLRWSLHRHGFNHVGVNRSLNQKVDRTHRLCLFFKYTNKFSADDLALLFRVRYALQSIQEAFRGINSTDIQVQVVSKYGKYLFEFVLSQQAVVDENPCQPVAYGFRHECCGDRRVYPSTDGTDCATCSYLLPDAGDGAFDKRTHRPGTMTT